MFTYNASRVVLGGLTHINEVDQGGLTTHFFKDFDDVSLLPRSVTVQLKSGKLATKPFDPVVNGRTNLRYSEGVQPLVDGTGAGIVNADGSKFLQPNVVELKVQLSPSLSEAQKISFVANAVYTLLRGMDTVVTHHLPIESVGSAVLVALAILIAD